MKFPPLYCCAFLFFAIILFNGNAQDLSFQHRLNEDKKPWTGKSFYNNPDNFQFAIVSDRTGGHREGVFGKGLEKINQLYPEFVMSVGDLIEGYTKDTTLLNEQWKEFHGILDSLNTKFFYVAGNHDYSNSAMAKQWKKRFGRDHYHFIYKNVLFLIANSNDGDGVMMGKDQIAYFKNAIEAHPNVRWTMVFLHHPMWVYGEVNGFNEIEEALKGREYTVFAGHTHRYMHEVKNDKNHYVLATTGGGSKLRGPKFGEFDHIGWVTMTDQGPKLVNLALSGILDHDISNAASTKESLALLKAADFKPLVLSKGGQRKIVLALRNQSDKVLHFKGRLYHHHQVEPKKSRYNIAIQPQSSQQLTLVTEAVGNQGQKDWDPLALEWEMAYDTGFMEPKFSLDGTEAIELNPTSDPNISFTEQTIFFKDLSVTIEHPYGDKVAISYTTDGSEPTPDSDHLDAELIVDKTTGLKVKLVDSEGFVSAVSTKTYEKVQPIKSIRVKKPKKGMDYTYFEGNYDSIPDFDQLGAPKSKGIAQKLDPDTIGQRLDHYAIQYQGYIQVPETDTYTFYLKSDDGANLYIADKLIVDNDGSHSTRERKGYVALKKGWHPIRIDYFEDYLGERLELEYATDKMEKAPVVFWH